MQTIWKGTLSFGLVTIGVRIVSTTRATRASFRQLHDKDRGPVKNVRTCSVCGERVDPKQIVKGAEVGKDAFVVVTPEELAAAEPESSTALAVREFVALDAVDARFVDGTYALAPLPGSERAYALLLDALSRRGEAAVGQVTLRNREHLVRVRPSGQILLADVLRYPEELRDLSEIEDAVAGHGDDVTDEERELADLLLQRMRREWDPSRYEDHYAKNVRALIAAKARGQVFQAPRREGAPTSDLLSALRETLARAQAEEGEAAPTSEA